MDLKNKPENHWSNHFQQNIQLVDTNNSSFPPQKKSGHSLLEKLYFSSFPLISSTFKTPWFQRYHWILFAGKKKTLWTNKDRRKRLLGIPRCHPISFKVWKTTRLEVRNEEMNSGAKSRVIYNSIYRGEKKTKTSYPFRRPFIGLQLHLYRNTGPSCRIFPKNLWILGTKRKATQRMPTDAAYQ